MRKNNWKEKNKEEDKDKPNHKKENPLLERYPTIDIKEFIEKNSISVKDPSLEKLEEKKLVVRSYSGHDEKKLLVILKLRNGFDVDKKYVVEDHDL